ncbi:unnamed protein product [Peniophora sp. CBMAI 1063]|nr:unnamed protein product [Peniophora sp. CBMAI 1063]
MAEQTDMRQPEVQEVPDEPASALTRLRENDHKASQRSPVPTSINSIDDDVLREIVFWAVIAHDPSWSSEIPVPMPGKTIHLRAGAMYRLALVSRRFKETVYGHAILWANIAGLPKTVDGFNLVLQRSRRVPLTLVTNWWGISEPQYDFAIKHMDRIGTLSAASDRDWHSFLSGRSAPALTALYLEAVSSKSEAGVKLDSPALDAPQLRFLYMRNSYIPIVAPRLEELNLFQCAKLLSPARLLDILSSTPHLRRLSLTSTLPPTRTNPKRWMSGEAGREIHLPCLEQLYLRYVRCDTVVKFMSHFVVPSEAGIEIALNVLEEVSQIQAVGQALRPFFSQPSYDSLRIREDSYMALSTRGSLADSPLILLRGPSRVEHIFDYIKELAPFFLPRHITTLDLGLTCEARSYDGEKVQKALLRIAPSVQTLSVEVRERLELSFLTDELSWVKFPALRTLKINWLDQVQKKGRGRKEWDGLRAWMKRVGAKQLETLYLDGWKHPDDNWCLARIKETLAEQKSKCEIVDERGEFHMLIDYTPVFGPPRVFMA